MSFCCYYLTLRYPWRLTLPDAGIRSFSLEDFLTMLDLAVYEKQDTCYTDLTYLYVRRRRKSS